MDRVAAAMLMIDTYCTPLSQQKEVQVGMELVPLPYTVVSQHWADPQSQILIEINPFSCDVSDALAHFTVKARGEFEARARAYTEQAFPALTADEPIGAEQWDLFALWTQYSLNDLRRWGVILARYQEEGPDSRTFYSVGWAAD